MDYIMIKLNRKRIQYKDILNKWWKIGENWWYTMIMTQMNEMPMNNADK